MMWSFFEEYDHNQDLHWNIITDEVMPKYDKESLH